MQQLLPLDKLRLNRSLGNLVKTLGHRAQRVDNSQLRPEERQVEQEMVEDLEDTLKTIMRI